MSTLHGLKLLHRSTSVGLTLVTVHGVFTSSALPLSINFLFGSGAGEVRGGRGILAAPQGLLGLTPPTACRTGVPRTEVVRNSSSSSLRNASGPLCAPMVGK